MFKALIGDLFESRAQTLVNTVNCVGVMGKGVAALFKQRYPQMFKDYAARCDRKEVRLGEPYLYRDLSGVRIVNFPTKDHWRSPSKLADIERGLDYLATHAAEWKIESLALPPLGCGNGGLKWSEVGPLIYRKLAGLPIEISAYAPYGTRSQQLTEAFLSAPSQMSLDGRGEAQKPLNPAWIVPLEVLREVQNQPYANPVGRVIFQKICYVVTEMGVPTDFQFGKGNYGPFSDGVKPALNDFSNRNWVDEHPLGRMMALRVTLQYERDRRKYFAVINEYRKKIAKTVDLFCRIKNTQQAEEVMTVMYASRQLKKSRKNGEVTEQDLYDYILDWKTTWNTPSKEQAVASAIRNLVLLGWMRLSISENLCETA